MSKWKILKSLIHSSLLGIGVTTIVTSLGYNIASVLGGGIILGYLIWDITNKL